MAYRITFDEKRTPLLVWSDLEKQTPLFKKEIEKDEIIIKVTGRNIYSKPFRHNIIYTIYDYLLPKNKREKLEIVVAFDKESEPVDVTFLAKELHTPRNPKELYEAIILVDKEYSKTGGGVLYKKTMHQTLDALSMLSAEIKEKILK